MTALIAPIRATSFESLIFFVYDREAVTKEADPPENAIVYFYPPSASIEHRISICGQLIGMSHFIHAFTGSRPALCKLQTEKVATVQSGRYTLALGGSLDEPDSLLIRQLETLHSLFTFYHGSLDRIRMHSSVLQCLLPKVMCETQKQFLSWMNVIWDCYLHFVRHYGDFLPGVFDPLPFLDLPKRVAATCFTKASYILQACQRRKHILGGCILYSNSILCTQLEPSITERLILLKPNQSNHPARPVKTEHDLPFGVRILNAFLTLSEYLNRYGALTESAYRQPGSPDSTGAFPDMYTTSPPCATSRNSSGEGNGDKPQHISSDGGANSSKGLSPGSSKGGDNSTVNSTGNVASAVPLDTAVGAVLPAEKEGMDSEIAGKSEPKLKHGADCLSEKKCKGKDVERVSPSAKEPRMKQRVTDESSLLLGTRNCSAENSGATVEEKEKVVKGEAYVLPTKKRIGREHSENETVLADKRSEEEKTGNEACTRMPEKKTGEELNESEASGVKTVKEIGEEQNGSKASAFLIEKEHNKSEATALIAEKKTGEDQNESQEMILDKTEHSTRDGIGATTYPSTGCGASSCESTFYDNVGPTMEGTDVCKLKLPSSTVFDSSSFESSFSSAAGLTMDSIDISGLKVVECSSYKLTKTEKEKILPRSSSSSPGREDPESCKLILGDKIRKVCEIVEDKSYLDNRPLEDVVVSEACCQACEDTQKSHGFPCAEGGRSHDVCCHNSKVRELQQNGHEIESNDPSSETELLSVEHNAERELRNCSTDNQETKLRTADSTDGETTSFEKQPETSGSTESSHITDVSSSKEHSLRSELIKTPIVCDSFSVRNLNSRSPEKFLDKSFTPNGTEILSSETDDSVSVNSSAACSAEVETGIDVVASGTERSASENSSSIAHVNRGIEDGTPVATSGIASEDSSSIAHVNRGIEDGTPVATSGIQETERNASGTTFSAEPEIHITNGHEGTSLGGGIEGPVDIALEEIEDDALLDQWRKPASPPESDVEGEELLFEEGGDDINQVEGLTHVNLYVQAHSKVVLILLAEEGLNNDCNSIKALWETSLNQLGELEFLVKQSLGDEPTTMYSDEYSFLVYDSCERTMKGNLNELVHQVDHLFCETTKVLHEQFENCSTLKDVMLRNRSSTVYGKSHLGRGTYFHLKGLHKTTPGVPWHRDPFLKVEKRATKVLDKDHAVNVF